MEADDLQFLLVNLTSYLLQYVMAGRFTERIGWQGGSDRFTMNCGRRDINEMLDVLAISHCVSKQDKYRMENQSKVIPFACPCGPFVYTAAR